MTDPRHPEGQDEVAERPFSEQGINLDHSQLYTSSHDEGTWPWLVSPVESIGSTNDASDLDFDWFTGLPGQEQEAAPLGFEPTGTTEDPQFNVTQLALHQQVQNDDFFAKIGAWRPPAPCSHCRRLRLQCFIIQRKAANPNPFLACSSCVALYRECSLSGQEKRPPLPFETARPVVGQLHGVNEEVFSMDDLLGIGNVDVPSLAAAPTPMPVLQPSGKRSNSRLVGRTKPLRNWFANHLDHPYPSDQDKTTLAEESGLSRSQVINWFTNARRRHRHSARDMSKTVFAQGSPVPQMLTSQMTPFERWRHSPPEEDPVSAAAIEEALQTGSSSTTDSFVQSNSLSYAHSGSDSCISPHLLWKHTHTPSVSSSRSSFSTDSQSAFSLSARGSEDGRPAVPAPPARRSQGARGFPCSVCSRTFSKRHDARRHERTVHHLRGAGDAAWICGIPLPRGGQGQQQPPFATWRVGQSGPECVFCGHAAPTEEHFRSHEWEACAQRAVPDRTFSRKDHLWQHLCKFHGCRKWEGWTPDLELLRGGGEGLGSRAL
ncbi:uncharacterized protein E0L32_004205 [Thyridium curvatum]|uniref:Homeobox and C2H2 transcription factor n=1 Tax=Thyridium curvatum TaxID=1093900 RepID=A0A507BI05_9PEZI|nr:uncharacterized protein E0L32_004205 [Thyridium curvatum]TPX16210.1 hypothetical protein E0L32_004205 [Thyridium curvatum]